MAASKRFPQEDDLRNEKIELLRKALVLETKVDERFRLQKELDQLEAEQFEASRVQRVSDRLMPHNFDLGDVVRTCFNELHRMEGLSGFVLPCDPHKLLEHFCQRLKHKVGRDWTEVRTGFVIRASHTTIDNTFSTITRVYRPATRRKNIIFGVHTEEQQLLPFWQRLCEECAEAYDKRLIAIFAVEAELSPTRGLITLPLPQFTFSDIQEWILEKWTALKWPEQIFHQWLRFIEQTCPQSNDCFHIGWIYDYLEVEIDILQDQPTPEEFLRGLQERYA